MPIKPSDRTMRMVVAEAEAGRVVLPNFQRDYVWRESDHKSLAASVLLGVPAGAMLLLKGNTNDFSYRHVGSREATVAPVVPAVCEYLLDGQQRISTLRMLFADPLAQGAWPDAFERTFGALQARYSLRVKPQDPKDQDLFGWRQLTFGGSLPAEPDLIVDALEKHGIFKGKDKDKWFHPTFAEKSAPAARSLAVGKHAAEAGSVPLWGLLDPRLNKNTSALGVALQSLGEARRAELYADFVDRNLRDFAVTELLLPGEDASCLTADLVDDRLRDRRSQWVQDVYSFLEGIREFQFATIELDDTELSKAIIIFGAINRGGSPLTPFDLVCAKYAALKSNKSLPEMIGDRIEAFPPVVPSVILQGATGVHWEPAPVVTTRDGSLSTSFRKQFLQVLAMVRMASEDPSHQYMVSDIKQERVLKLSPEELESSWPSACDGLVRAWQFLQLRCGVRSEGSLRNKLILLPISIALSNESVSPTIETYNRLEYWYWSSVLTSRYTERQNDQAIWDSNNLLGWLTGRVENPFSARADLVLNDPGYSDKATLLRLDGAADIGADVDLYLLQLVLALGGRDMLTGVQLSAATDDLQDHHLIPLGTATSVGQSTREIRKKKSGELAMLLNSPLNRAYVLDSSNQAIGARALGQYMNGITGASRASLFLAQDDNLVVAPGEGFVNDVRAILGTRFDMIRTAIITRLDKLVS